MNITIDCFSFWEKIEADLKIQIPCHIKNILL